MKYLEFDYVQRKLGVSSNAVKKGLQVLQDRDHMLKYESIGELPLIKLMEERHSNLSLSMDKLEKHRNNLLQKLEYMKGYISTDNCREVYIRHYFGEENVEACGHCDNCLDSNEAAVPIKNEEIHQIRNVLKEGSLSFTEIAQRLGWNKGRTKRLLSYLLREQMLITKGDEYVLKDS